MFGRILKIVKLAAADFSDDEALTRAAALAFYSALSFAPLLVLLVWVASAVGDEAQLAVLDQLGELMGEEARKTADAVINNAESQPSLGSLSAVLGVAALFFSATGVFVQLQQTLNRIWDVERKPGAGVRSFIRTRLISTGMLAALGFLLVISLVVSAAIGFVFSHLGPLAWVGSLISSIVVFAVAFSAVYKTVPDCEIRMKDAALGGLITAILFALGKEAIGLYIGRGSVGSAYGAAGSLLVLLVWVYYSGIVILFGAELTQVYAVEFGDGIQPNEHARRTESNPARKGREPQEVRGPGQP